MQLVQSPHSFVPVAPVPVGHFDPQHSDAEPQFLEAGDAIVCALLGILVALLAFEDDKLHDAIEKGLLYGTVYNDSVKQADAILALVDYILNDKNFDDFPYAITHGYYINTDGDIITQANVTDFTGRS